MKTCPPLPRNLLSLLTHRGSESNGTRSSVPRLRSSVVKTFYGLWSRRAKPPSWRLSLRSLVLAIVPAILLPLTACRPSGSNAYQGYLEGEYVRVGAPVPGTLVRLTVTRGAEIKPGDSLFELEAEAEKAAVREASNRVDQTAARLENLRKGRRPSELAALESRLTQQQASLTLWENELARRQRLFADQVIAQAELDHTRAQRDAFLAARDATRSELETARLGAREDEIIAASAELQVARASLDRAQWSLNQKHQRAAVGAKVHDTLYRPGEFVVAGAPVVSLLPRENLKVRFFVPEPELSRVPVGTDVEVSIDGQSQPLSARVTYVGTQPEFTPPVIYSRETRAKFVFLVEAALASVNDTLHPGQPVDVHVVRSHP
ncbi:MAG: HlyD family efflux transporter periplasmic adaptor subunit [Verrucomicrobiales bacterium]|nr:HlyD family efflux transporter periplasmic adaptor subunit [Verrucomicrobiales bacterium]